MHAQTILDHIIRRNTISFANHTDNSAGSIVVKDAGEEAIVCSTFNDQHLCRGQGWEATVQRLQIGC